MTIFKLPDLGEGLPDAEIHAWFVKPGDEVRADQPLIAMETAKAIVELPCPEAGVIETLFGQPGDLIKTGAALVEYTPEFDTTTDQGTVVGRLQRDEPIFNLHHLTLPASKRRLKTTPLVRRLAKQAGVDLYRITPTGEHGTLTLTDLQHHLTEQHSPPAGFTALQGTRRAMLRNMQLSHQEVVSVSLFDEADVSSWITSGDITLHVIRALVVACAHEPALNAWFHSTSGSRQCFSEVNLGLAMDSEEGLFVPVIRDVHTLPDHTLRQLINEYKQTVAARRLPPEQFQGATITLSNFGKFAGRFATPLIIPPMVAILAVGRLYTGVVSVQGVPQARALLPLSLSFDHRAVTGGEASRFLGYLLAALQT